MTTAVTSPFPVFFDRAGLPLSSGSVYIGTDGQNPQSNPVQVYFDEAMTKPAAQPITTIGGTPRNSGTPSRLFVAANSYSITVRDQVGALVSTALSVDGQPVIDQQYIAVLINPRTDAEILAGVTPVDYTWPEGWVPRYGAVDDGTDQTAPLLLAMAVGMQGVTIYFPKNKQYVTTQLGIKAGMKIQGFGPGVDGRCALKLAANQPRFQRILTTEDYLWDDDVDSPVLEIDGMSFDGNYLNQGTYTGFEKEHQQHIGLFAQNTKAGRLKARVSNCYHNGSTSDGVLTFYNTDVVVENGVYVNCFRSSVACTGGYAKLRIDNCRGNGDTWPSRFQVEIDSAGFGSSKAMELLMDNCDWDGGLDIALYGGSWISISNTYFKGSEQFITNLDADSSGVYTYFTAMNSFFRVGDNNSNTHRLFHYSNSKFIGCVIEWTNNITHTSLIQPGTLTKQSLLFDTCTFRGDSTYHTTATVAGASATWASGLLTVNTGAAHGLAANDYVELAGWTTDVNGIYRVNTAADSDTITVPFARDPGAVTVGSGTTRKRSVLNALSMSADTAANQNEIYVINSNFHETVDCCMDMQQGGWLTMRGNHVNGGLLYDAGASASFVFYTRIGQYTTGPKHRQMMHITGSVAGCLLEHEGTYLTVERSGFTRSGNLTGLTMRGYRMIYGSGGALSTDPCLMGDIYNRDVPLASTAQQYWALTGAQSGAAATWKAGTTLAA